MRYIPVTLSLLAGFGLWLMYERVQYNKAMDIREKHLENAKTYEREKVSLKNKYDQLLSDSRVKMDLGLYGTVQSEFMIKDLELDLRNNENTEKYLAALNSIQRYNVVFRVK